LEPFGILVFLEPGRKLFYANPQAQRLVGADRPELAAAEILRQLNLEPVPSPPAELGPFLALEATITVNQRQLKASVYRDAASTLIFLVDITELCRLQSMAAEIEISDVLNRLFSVLRHEIGNSVNSIGISLRVLEVKLTKAGFSELLDYCSRIAHELRKISDLLATFKAAKLGEDYKEELVDVRKIADLVLSLFRSEYPFLALELTTPQPMFVALGSERLLEHALINLVRNAVEAVHGLSDPRVLIRLGTSGSKTTIDVEDNGPGIAPELSGELFKPFFSTKPGGTGLGLFLAKTWIARMGGTLTVESAPGCTRFSILLRRPPGAP
jgi:signal transduction histidine kinase